VNILRSDIAQTRAVVITVNAPGVRSLHDARPMTFGVGRVVTAHWNPNDTVSVFVGLALHYDGPRPEGIDTYTSREFYAWVRDLATAAEGRECD
jgi:hypothetical protein